jgi:micrococcal nuclease
MKRKKTLTLVSFLLSLLLSSLNFSDIDFMYGPGYGARVLSIADGDTITVMHKRRKEKIRLYGIDCPEKLQEFGQQARAKTISLTSGQLVSIIPVHRDRYGRTVAYVLLQNGTNLNYTLVSEGYAWWFRAYAQKDVQFAFRELLAKARKKGLWSSDDAVAPWRFRKGISVSRSANCTDEESVY